MLYSDWPENSLPTWDTIVQSSLEQVISQELETGHIEAAQTVSIGDMVYMVLRGLDTAPDLHSEPFSNICIALGGGVSSRPPCQVCLVSGGS